MNIKFTSIDSLPGLLQYIMLEEENPEQVNYVIPFEIHPSLHNFKLISKRDIPAIKIEDSSKHVESDNIKSAEQSFDDKSFATETLALIYERQGALKQALDIYKKLIESNPEKYSRFRERISELETKLKN